MSDISRKPGWLLEYALLSMVYVLVRPMGASLRNRLGRRLGGFIFKRIGFRRSVILQQLRQAFPEIGPMERWDLGVKICEQLGVSLLEFMTLGDLSRDALLAKVDFAGEDHLRSALEAGRGVIIMTAHFGNFELLGSAIPNRGYPCSAVARSQSNPYVDRLQNKIRERSGMTVIKADASVRGVAKALKAGECVVMLPDVNAGDDGVFVEFLGRPASTPRGIGYFSWRMNVPVVPAFLVRQADDRHILELTEPIYPDTGMEQDAAIAAITAAFSARLELFIRKYPDHWLWLHRRWKTQPSRETIA